MLTGTAASFASLVGGNLVAVNSIIKGGRTHDFDQRPSLRHSVSVFHSLVVGYYHLHGFARHLSEQ